MGFIRRLKEDLALHERSDESKHIQMPKKLRFLIAGVFTLILVIKITGMVVTSLMVNPGLKETFGHYYTDSVNSSQLLWTKLVSGTFIVLAYGSTAVVSYNTKHNLTEGFFYGLYRRCKRLGIVILIVYGISLYLHFNAFDKAVNLWNSKTPADMHVSITFAMFIPYIIALSLTLVTYGTFVGISFWSFKKFNIDVTKTPERKKKVKHNKIDQNNMF